MSVSAQTVCNKGEHPFKVQQVPIPSHVHVMYIPKVNCPLSILTHSASFDRVPAVFITDYSSFQILELKTIVGKKYKFECSKVKRRNDKIHLQLYILILYVFFKFFSHAAV